MRKAGGPRRPKVGSLSLSTSPLSPFPPPLSYLGLDLIWENAGMTSIVVAWSKGSSAADPEPEPPLEAMQPCILKTDPPLTLAVHLYTRAVPPRCRHSRPLTHRNARNTHPCSLIHVRVITARVMRKEVMVISHPKLPNPEAARRGYSRSQSPDRGENPVCNCVLMTRSGTSAGGSAPHC